MHPESKGPPTLLVTHPKGDRRIMVPKSKLLVVSGPLQGQEFMLERDTFTIGSASGNDLVIQDETISRRHCEIQREPNGYLIRDVGSTNGTFVQGVRVSEAFLDQGTEFQIGHSRIVFCPLREVMEYEVSPNEAFGSLLGRSIPMRRVFHIAERYSPTDATILIEGETGTGKEVLAEEIHSHSKRKDKPFIVIDCGTLARELVASELFGHVKGSFTGANTDRAGAFEAADGGTVFLDEIGTLSGELQPKLLRVLEKKEIKRVGSNHTRKIDVRIICATNTRLQNEVNAGRFREDLYFRISVVHVDLPPLRTRKEDIPLLTEKFLRDFHGDDVMQHVVEFDKTMAAFSRHDWPGNVRELRNVVELASLGGRRPIDLGAFLYASSVSSKQSDTRMNYLSDRPFKEAKDDLIKEFEMSYLRTLLEKHNGNVSRAAREAGIERTYLQRLIRKYGLKT